MRDEDEREARSSVERDEQLQDLRLHHHVERSRRLVGQQHLGLAGERHRDRRALAHASGELVRVARDPVGGNADTLEQLRRSPVRRRPSAIPCSSIGSTSWSPIRFTGLNAFIAPWKTIATSRQRCGFDGLLAARQDVLALEQDRARDARARREQAHERKDRGRLPATRLAHEAEPVTGFEAEADPLDGVQLGVSGQVEPDVEVLDLEQDR